MIYYRLIKIYVEKIKNEEPLPNHSVAVEFLIQELLKSKNENNQENNKKD